MDDEYFMKIGALSKKIIKVLFISRRGRCQDSLRIK